MGCGRCLSRSSLLLHLSVALPEVKHLDVRAGVDFVNGVSGGSTRLSVQVVTLDKHCVVTEASHPHVSLALTLQLNPFTDVKPRSLDGLGAMDVAELPQAEAVPSRGVDIAVYGHDGAGGGNLKRLPDLDVHLKVGDGAPVVRSWMIGYRRLEGELIVHWPVVRRLWHRRVVL